MSPNFEIAKNNMAIALTDLGTKVYSNFRFSFFWLSFLLMVYFQVKLEGDINQGVAYYKRALYYNWHYADAMYNLGVAYGEMLKFDMVNVIFRSFSLSTLLYIVLFSRTCSKLSFMCRQLYSMNLLSTSIPIVQRHAIILELFIKIETTLIKPWSVIR